MTAAGAANAMCRYHHKRKTQRRGGYPLLAPSFLLAQRGGAHLLANLLPSKLSNVLDFITSHESGHYKVTIFCSFLFCFLT